MTGEAEGDVADWTVERVLERCPGCAMTFVRFRTACPGCALARFCTMADVAGAVGAASRDRVGLCR